MSLQNSLSPLIYQYLYLIVREIRIVLGGDTPLKCFCRCLGPACFSRKLMSCTPSFLSSWVAHRGRRWSSKLSVSRCWAGSASPVQGTWPAQDSVAKRHGTGASHTSRVRAGLRRHVPGVPTGMTRLICLTSANCGHSLLSSLVPKLRYFRRFGTAFG